MTSVKHSQNSRIILNTFSMYLRMFVTMIVGFFAARLTLEILGVRDFGLNNLVGGFVAMFAFLNKSMGTAVQRFISIAIGERDFNKIKLIMSNSLIIHFGIAGVTFILVEVFIFLFFHDLNIPKERLFAANIVVQTTVFSMVLNIVNVPYAALLRSKEDFSKTAILDVIQSLLRLGLLFILTQIKYDKLVSYAVLNLSVTLLYLVSINFLAKRYEESKFKLIFRKDLITEMLSFTGVYFISVMVRIFRDKGVIIVLIIFFGLTVNAAYAVADQVKSMVESFSTNFRSTVVPQIMSSYGQRDEKRMFQLVFTSTKFTNYLLFFIAIPFIFEVNYILKIWLKNPPEYSSQFVILLLINILIESFTYFLIQVIHSTGHIKKYSLVQSLLYSLSIVAIIIVLKLGFDFYSVVYVIILCSIALLMITIRYAKELANLDVHSFVKDVVLKNTVVFLIPSLILFIVNHNFDESLGRFVLNLILTIVSVSLTGYFIGLDIKEKEFVKKQIYNILLKIKSK